MAADRFDHLFIEPASFDAALAFYRDGLGWTELFAWGAIGEPRGIGLTGGGMKLVLAERHPAADRSKSHGINGNRPTLHLTVRDLDARHRELAAKGLALFAPEATHWGTRWFVAKDPDGNLLAFEEAADSTEATTPAAATAAFASAVAPLLAELEASANAHDTDRHMALYASAPSLTFVFNGETVRGWERLRELQRGWWDDGRAKGSYRYVGDPVFEALGEDAGITTVRIEARREAGDGAPVSKVLAHSALWRRLPEGWRITYAHESSDK